MDSPAAGGADLPSSVIVIVGVVCGTVVVALSVVLVILCCRRRRANKNYNNEPNKPTSGPATVSGSVPLGPVSKTTAPRQPATDKGHDNPVIDNADSIDFDDTAAYQPTPQTNGDYGGYPAQRHPPPQRVANGYRSEPPPAYEDYYNNDNPYGNRRKEPYGHHSPDSATKLPPPDAPAPAKKKVIHEVIV